MSRKISGANAEAIRSTAPEVILAGPANSGKTFAILVKLHRYCLDNPKVKVLMLRKTRVSLNESALLTWETEIYPRALLRHNYVQRGSRREYRYPNGSRIVVAGLDNPEKLLSARYDLIYVNECSELLEEYWSMAGSRLLSTRGPYRQLIGDCNPPRTGKEHWIWKRHVAGNTELLFSEHKLNPAMTVDAMARLDSLHGDLRRRFMEGSWDAMPEDGLFKAEWWRILPLEVWQAIRDNPAQNFRWARGWDPAGGQSKGSDFSSGGLVGHARDRSKDTRIIIADVTRGQWSPKIRNDMMVSVARSDAKFEPTNYFWKSRTPDMNSSIRDGTSEFGFWAITERGRKYQRAQRLAVQAESGNVWLAPGTWNASFIQEAAQFTDEDSDEVRKDDQVDCVCLADSQLIKWN